MFALDEFVQLRLSGADAVDVPGGDLEGHWALSYGLNAHDARIPSRLSPLLALAQAQTSTQTTERRRDDTRGALWCSHRLATTTSSPPTAARGLLEAARPGIGPADAGRHRPHRGGADPVDGSDHRPRELRPSRSIQGDFAPARLGRRPDRRRRRVRSRDEGKVVVWIDGGLHATEVLTSQQLIETAYQLVHADGCRDAADPA